MKTDKLSYYDIAVTTLDDMLASIEDNITDDENMLDKLEVYLCEETSSYASYEDRILYCMVTLGDYDYKGLKQIVNLLGINQ